MSRLCGCKLALLWIIHFVKDKTTRKNAGQEVIGEIKAKLPETFIESVLRGNLTTVIHGVRWRTIGE